MLQFSVPLNNGSTGKKKELTILYLIDAVASKNAILSP